MTKDRNPSPPLSCYSLSSFSPDDILDEGIVISVYYDRERLFPGLQCKVISVMVSLLHET